MNIEDRVRAELRAEGSRIVVPAADLDGVRGRSRIQRRLRVVAGIAAVLVGVVAVIVGSGMVLSGNGGNGLPVAGGETETTTPVSTTPTTIAPTSTVVPDDAGSVVIASRDGIVIVRDGEVVDRVDIGPVMTAVDDPRGGYVVQIGQSASSILHVEESATDITELIPAPEGETLTLRDVVMIEGSPTVIYTSRLSGVAPEEAREDLRVFDLTTGDDRFVTQVGGYESGATQVSYGSGRFIVSMTAEGYTWFEAYDLFGASVPFDGNPRSEADSAEDFLVWVGVGAVAPDGETFAFVEGSPRSEAPFRLVVVDLPSGERLHEADVLDTARESNVMRLEWDGAMAVVSLAEEQAIIVREGKVVERLPVAGTAVGVGSP